MLVLHPNEGPAREFVRGRVVNFDEDGIAEVTLPSLVAHYDHAGYSVVPDPDEAPNDEPKDADEDEPGSDDDGDA